jgi:hypothetical protein
VDIVISASAMLMLNVKRKLMEGSATLLPYYLKE